MDRREVEHLGADRHAAAKGLAAAGAAKRGKREILDREVATGFIGGTDPAAKLRIVRAVHGANVFGRSRHTRA
ncbi:MAG: hypothetical protein PVSMB6_08320 [Steroidobacteraceae bacterium]